MKTHTKTGLLLFIPSIILIIFTLISIQYGFEWKTGNPTGIPSEFESPDIIDIRPLGIGCGSIGIAVSIIWIWLKPINEHTVKKEK